MTPIDVTAVRLGVIDPSTLTRAGLVSLLRAMGFADTADAASITEMRHTADPSRLPELLLLDLSLGLGDIAAAMREIEVSMPGCKVVFLAQTLDLGVLGACFAAGASGYLLKDISREALQGTLGLVAVGEKVFPSALALHMAGLTEKFGERQSGPAKLLPGILSEREIDILRCLVTGYPNKTIAANLSIAESTVKVHLKRILRKTRASNRTQAAIWAVENGLADTEDAARRA